VTRKITDAAAKIHLGKLDVLELGNLKAKRDWGYAPEYVEGMWRMLQADEPGTFVLATGTNHSVRDFVTMAFRSVDVELEWRGQGKLEKGINKATGKTVVAVNPKFYRPAEVDQLIGDASQARDILGWEARTGLEEMCRMMVEADKERNRNGSCF